MVGAVVGMLAAAGTALSMLVSVSNGAEAWASAVSGTISTGLAACLAQSSSESRRQCLIIYHSQSLRSCM